MSVSYSQFEGKLWTYFYKNFTYLLYLLIIYLLLKETEFYLLSLRQRMRMKYRDFISLRVSQLLRAQTRASC